MLVFHSGTSGQLQATDEICKSLMVKSPSASAPPSPQDEDFPYAITLQDGFLD